MEKLHGEVGGFFFFSRLNPFHMSHGSHQDNGHRRGDAVRQGPPVLWAAVQAFFQDVSLPAEAGFLKHHPAEDRNRRGGTLSLFKFTFVCSSAS